MHAHTGINQTENSQGIAGGSIELNRQGGLHWGANWLFSPSSGFSSHFHIELAFFVNHLYFKMHISVGKEECHIIERWPFLGLAGSFEELLSPVFSAVRGEWLLTFLTFAFTDLQLLVSPWETARPQWAVQSCLCGGKSRSLPRRSSEAPLKQEDPEPFLQDGQHLGGAGWGALGFSSKCDFLLCENRMFTFTLWVVVCVLGGFRLLGPIFTCPAWCWFTSSLRLGRPTGKNAALSSG